MYDILLWLAVNLYVSIAIGCVIFAYIFNKREAYKPKYRDFLLSNNGLALLIIMMSVAIVTIMVINATISVDLPEEARFEYSLVYVLAYVLSGFSFAGMTVWNIFHYLVKDFDKEEEVEEESQVVSDDLAERIKAMKEKNRQ